MSLRSALILLFIAAGLAGCGRPPADQDAFNREVVTLGLVGKSVVVAAEELEARGYSVHRRAADPGWEDQRDFLTAGMNGVHHMIFRREWRIVLRLEAESVTESKAYVFDHYL